MAVLLIALPAPAAGQPNADALASPTPDGALGLDAPVSSQQAQATLRQELSSLRSVRSGERIAPAVLAVAGFVTGVGAAGVPLVLMLFSFAPCLGGDCGVFSAADAFLDPWGWVVGGVGLGVALIGVAWLIGASIATEPLAMRSRDIRRRLRELEGPRAVLGPSGLGVAF